MNYRQQQHQMQQPNPAQQDAGFGSRAAHTNGESMNNFANGANQNSGNFISNRSSTRIHAPPGGVSSISFGGGDSVSQQQVGGSRGSNFARAISPLRNSGAGLVSNNPGVSQSNAGAYASMKQQPTIFSGATAGAAGGGYSGGIASKSNYAHGGRGRAESMNNFANGANQNCGNFISERSSTRIHAPPGGQSQISFG